MGDDQPPEPWNSATSPSRTGCTSSSSRRRSCRRPMAAARSWSMPWKVFPTPVMRSGWPPATSRTRLDTELVASFAIDELLDYRSRRPLMTFKTDHFTHYDDPELSLYAMHDSVGTPFLLLAGMEPDLKWERFITAVRLLAERLGVRQTIGLGTIPMAVPHTRPVTMTAHSNDHELIADFTPWIAEVQVPGQRVEPAGIPDGPARPRGRRLHRARPALPGADRLSGGRRRRCWSRSPRPARCSSR